MTPEQLSILRDAIRQGPEGCIPYAHAATVIGPLALAVVTLFYLWKGEKDGRLSDAKERIEEQKAVAVALDRSTEALRAARGP